MPIESGAPITIYHCGAFGGATIRGKLVKLFPNGLRYIEKGKRKEQVFGAKTMLVVLGHNPANPPSGLVKCADGEHSRYGSFDKRYYTDFNKWASHLKSLIPPDNIIFDLREYEGETEPTEDCI